MKKRLLVTVMALFLLGNIQIDAVGNIQFFADPVSFAQSGETYYVSNSGNNGNPGTSSQPWLTLQHAADTVAAGDTVIIRDGTYAGFRAASGGASGFPITFEAESGSRPVLNSVSPNAWKGSIIEIEEYDWWVIDGLEVTGAPTNAGVDIRVANHVTVKNCYCHHNQKWGIFTGFVEYFTAEYNECAYSVEEHGIYHSNSGDNAVIRYNICHDNTACGIQINADPRTEDGDHISSDNLITHNILYGNGAAGGAAINLASVRTTLIANNLIYDNQAGGIAAWDDGAGNEWGSKDNRYYNNTIHMPSGGRWAINLNSGSTGSQIYNNILIHENSARGGIEIDTSSLTDFLSDYNILCRTSVDDSTMTLASWQSGHGVDTNSFCETAAQTFVTPGGDYHLLTSSEAMDGGTTLADVTTDLEGTTRPRAAGYDMGAYENCSSPPVKILETSITYTKLMDACDAALDGETILCVGETIDEDLVIDDMGGKTIIIEGGYNCDFTDNGSGVTLLSGFVEIRKGTMVLAGGAFGIGGSPSGNITYTLDPDVYRIEAKSGAVTENVSLGLDGLSSGEGDAWLNISPDGNWLLLETERFHPDCSGWACLAVVASDLSRGDAVMVNGNVVHPEGFSAIGSDGAVIVYPSHDGRNPVSLWSITRNPDGTYGQAVDITATSSYDQNYQPAISADGTQVLFDCTDAPYTGATSICEVGIDGTGFRVVLLPEDSPAGYPDTGELHHPDHAPNGSIVTESDWDGEQIWRLNSGATVPEKITNTFHNDNSPCVLPNGNIASLWLNRPENSNGDHELKVMASDGTGYFMLVTNVDVADVGLGCGR